MSSNSRQASQVGVSVWLDGDTGFLLDESHEKPKLTADGDLDGEPVECAGWVLGFAKVEDHWRIAVRPGHRIWTPALLNTGDDDMMVVGEGEPRPLLKAPRGVRVEAAGYLEDLIESISERAAQFANDIDRVQELTKD
jgi:hypothetical protein